jgi:hypothetical protein
VLDDLRDTTSGRGDYRQARLHALQQGGSEFLVSGRHRKDVGRAQQAGNSFVRDEAQEVNAPSDSEPVREAF